MPRELGERLDGSRQAALVTSSSVRVKNALAAHGVDHALGVLESFLSSGLIAGEDELANALDSGTVLAALSREVLIAGKDGRACGLGWYWPFSFEFLKVDAAVSGFTSTSASLCFCFPDEPVCSSASGRNRPGLSFTTMLLSALRMTRRCNSASNSPESRKRGIVSNQKDRYKHLSMEKFLLQRKA